MNIIRRCSEAVGRSKLPSRIESVREPVFRRVDLGRGGCSKQATVVLIAPEKINGPPLLTDGSLSRQKLLLHHLLPSVLHDFPLSTANRSSSSVMALSLDELLATVHSNQSATEPFYTSNRAEDQDKAIGSIRKMMEVDASDKVFAVLAHGTTLLNAIDRYQATTNHWHTKKQATKSSWLSLNDFQEHVREFVKNQKDREYKSDATSSRME